MIKTHLSKEQQQALLKKHWYFQGFNGTPGLLSGPTRGNVEEGHEILGYGYQIIVEFYDKDKCYYLYDWKDLEDGLKIILEKTKKDPKYPNWLVQKDKELREAHEKVVKKIEQINIKTLSYQDAIKLYHEFMRSYRLAIAVSLIIECFTYPTEELIRNKIKQELEKQGKLNEIEKVQTLLCGAVNPSFIGKHQIQLLQIAVEIKTKNLTDIFTKKETREIEKEVQKTEQGKEILKKIEVYQKKYFWMSNAYAAAKILPVEHFIHEVAEVCKKHPNPKEELEAIEHQFVTLPQRKKETYKNYNWSEELRQLIVINDAMGIIHDVRKEVITHANHFIDQFLSRFGKEKNISPELMRYISDYEINEKDLKHITKEMLEKRHKESIFITYHPGEQYILTGKEAAEIIHELDKTQQHETEEILKGNCASQGYAKGIVKVCRGIQEVAKFKEGEILVACMTQPEFVPAMKKAAAIVTDEGGLTCHAAIISRELKKPCIISTKKATRVLKDGMLVEVNATEGYLKILKQ